MTFTQFDELVKLWEILTERNSFWVADKSHKLLLQACPWWFRHSVVVLATRTWTWKILLCTGTASGKIWECVLYQPLWQVIIIVIFLWTLEHVWLSINMHTYCLVNAITDSHSNFLYPALNLSNSGVFHFLSRFISQCLLCNLSHMLSFSGGYIYVYVKKSIFYRTWTNAQTPL